MKFQATDIIKKKLIATWLAALLLSSCAGNERHKAGLPHVVHVVAEDEQNTATTSRFETLLVAGAAGVAAIVGGVGVQRWLGKRLLQKQWWSGRIVKYGDYTLLKHLRVSEFWHHEVTGTLEARELMASLQSKGYPLHTTDVALYDGGFPSNPSGKKLTAEAEEFLNLKDSYQLHSNKGRAKYHGMSVASLITGRTPIGASSKASISLLAEIIMVFDSLPSAKLTNFSSGFSRDVFDIIPDHYTAKDMRKIMAEMLNLNDGDAIVVSGTGNHFPAKGNKGKEIYIPIRGLDITVGSVDHQGVVSAYSASGDVPLLTIMHYQPLTAKKYGSSVARVLLLL